MVTTYKYSGDVRLEKAVSGREVSWLLSRDLSSEWARQRGGGGGDGTDVVASVHSAWLSLPQCGAWYTVHAKMGSRGSESELMNVHAGVSLCMLVSFYPQLCTKHRSQTHQTLCQTDSVTTHYTHSHPRGRLAQMSGGREVSWFLPRSLER